MKKFATPVAMRVTKEQYLRDLKEPMEKMGYYIPYDLPNSRLNIIMTNFGGSNKKVSFNNCFNDNKYNIESYNPKLFLALAAMTYSDIPNNYEYYVCLMSSRLGDYTKGEFYQSNLLSTKSRLFTILDNKNSETNGWRLDYFRKATKEELINHFNNNQKSINMKNDNRFPFKLSLTDARRIIDISCSMWRIRLADLWGANIVLKKPITVSEDEYKTMRKACNESQNQLFDRIFGKDTKEVEFKLGDRVKVISGGDGAYIADGRFGYIVPNATTSHSRNYGNIPYSMNETLYTIFVPENQMFYSLCEGFELELLD